MAVPATMTLLPKNCQDQMDVRDDASYLHLRIHPLSLGLHRHRLQCLYEGTVPAAQPLSERIPR